MDVLTHTPKPQSCPLAHECSARSWNNTKTCASFVSFEDCLAKLTHYITNSDKHCSGGERTHKDIETQVAEASEQSMCELVDASWFMDHLRHPIVHSRMPSAMLHNIIPCTIEIVHMQWLCRVSTVSLAQCIRE